MDFCAAPTDFSIIFKGLPKFCIFFLNVCGVASVAIMSQFLKKNKTVALHLFYLSFLLLLYFFFFFFLLSPAR